MEPDYDGAKFGNAGEVPGWFWDLLAETRPSVAALASRLENMTEDQVLAFARTYRKAAESICDYWDGPNVDGLQFSEDDTEDLCNWIVSQGPTLWAEAVRLRGTLDPMVQLYRASEAGRSEQYPAWQPEVHTPAYLGFQAPESIAYAVFEARFGRSLYDIL